MTITAEEVQATPLVHVQPCWTIIPPHDYQQEQRSTVLNSRPDPGSGWRRRTPIPAENLTSWTVAPARSSADAFFSGPERYFVLVSARAANWPEHSGGGVVMLGRRIAAPCGALGRRRPRWPAGWRVLVRGGARRVRLPRVWGLLRGGRLIVPAGESVCRLRPGRSVLLPRRVYQTVERGEQLACARIRSIQVGRAGSSSATRR